MFILDIWNGFLWLRIVKAMELDDETSVMINESQIVGGRLVRTYIIKHCLEDLKGGKDFLFFKKCTQPASTNVIVDHATSTTPNTPTTETNQIPITNNKPYTL